MVDETVAFGRTPVTWAFATLAGIMALWAFAARAEPPAPTLLPPGIEVVAPTFAEPGVVGTAAELRFKSRGGAAATLVLDRRIECVAQVARFRDIALVIGQAKYGWILQRLDLQAKRVLQVEETAHPQPTPSPDGAQVAYTVLGYRLGGHVVMIMDVASGGSAPVFPEENAAAGQVTVIEYDGFWHEYLWGNFLWRQDGKALLFVAARGVQWWALDLCLVDLSNGPERPRIARRRLDFAHLFKEGHGPSESCKYNVTTIAWMGPEVLRVTFGGCFFMTANFIEVAAPDRAAAVPAPQVAGAPPGADLGDDLLAGFAKMGETPWPWVVSISPSGTLVSVMGKRFEYFSRAPELDLELRPLVLGSAGEATEAASRLRSGNQAVTWIQLPQGAPPPCAAGRCWSSTDRGLYRLVTQSGRFCLLITAYGRDVLPGEEQVTDPSVKERDALLLADLVVRKAGLLGCEP